MAAEGRITTGSGRTLFFLNKKFVQFPIPYVQNKEPIPMLKKNVVSRSNTSGISDLNNADPACKSVCVDTIYLSGLKNFKKNIIN